MSFRITARDYKDGEERGTYHQVYGNHDFPSKLKDYLLSKGVTLDSDDCFYDYDIEDVQGLLDVMLEIHDEQVEDDSYWDFKPGARYKVDTPDDLISYIDYKFDAAIVLIMYNFYKAFESSIESYWDEAAHAPKYKIKDGKHIYLSGS